MRRAEPIGAPHPYAQKQSAVQAPRKGALLLFKKVLLLLRPKRYSGNILKKVPENFHKKLPIAFGENLPIPSKTKGILKSNSPADVMRTPFKTLFLTD